MARSSIKLLPMHIESLSQYQLPEAFIMQVVLVLED